MRIQRNVSHESAAEARPVPTKQSPFTLIELLVVVAIIMVLAGQLLAAMQRARALARATYCVSNQKQIATAMNMFVDDNGKYPHHYTSNSGTWVLSRNGTDRIINGTLYEYVGDYNVYRCPDERRGKNRSYSMSHHIGPRWNQNWGLGEDYLRPESVVETSRTMLTLDEYDNRSYNINSFYLNSTKWVDIPGRWHFNSVVLSFTDTHVERWAHRDPRTRVIDGHYANARGNIDHRRLFNAIIGDSRYYDAW